jgi:hypothetical protein
MAGNSIEQYDVCTTIQNNNIYVVHFYQVCFDQMLLSTALEFFLNHLYSGGRPHHYRRRPGCTRCRYLMHKVGDCV